MEGPSHRAGKERYNGGTPKNRECRCGNTGVSAAGKRGQERAGWELEEGPSTSVIVTQAIKINQSMNQSTITHQPASLTNQPTIQRIIHRSSQPDEASGQPSALPACPRNATCCTAQLPMCQARGCQSPASICILSTIRTPPSPRAAHLSARPIPRLAPIQKVPGHASPTANPAVEPFTSEKESFHGRPASLRACKPWARWH